MQYAQDLICGSRESHPRKRNWPKALRIRRGLLGFYCVASLVASGFVGFARDAHGFSASEVYRNASSSVVLIFGFSDSGAGSSGTGSILTNKGLILTNSHVITNSDTGRLFSNLVVYFKPIPISGDNRKDLTAPYLVEVLARDPILDLALLQIKDAPPGLRPIEVANSDEVEIGESVAAIGHPGGGGLWTLTTGTISSKRQDHDRDIFQTDTAINPGNSGGPLLDEFSRLVGVNTFVRRVNDQGLPLEGLNYSLRSSLALDWVNQQGIVHIPAVRRTAVAGQESDRNLGRPAPPEGLRRELERGRDEEPQAERAKEPPAGDRMDRAGIVRPSVVPRVAPPPEPRARAFKGAHGEEMYGVPNLTIDLNEALVHARKGYQSLTERADDSIREMNQLLDEYDNF